jgi:type I restriction enzyme R subunit
MVVCHSSDQAKMMKEIFDEKYSQKYSSALILHDVGDKEERKDLVEDFKAGKIDFLFVYNMLLTGFDAKRLKKLYLGRVIKKHNLLQTLTRVNRPYKNFKFGYVVDFADISKEFDATNKAYFDELNEEYGEDEMRTYSDMLLSKEEIETEIENIKEKLFSFDLENKENFSKQISAINDPKEVLEIKKALGTARDLYNLIRLFGHYDLLEKIDFRQLSTLYNEATNRLNLLNLKDSLEKGTENTNLINLALEDIIFSFRKVSEEELVIADKYKDTLRKTRVALGSNFDTQDPEYIALYKELKRLFENKNLDEISQEDMNKNIATLEKIYAAITELNRRNNLLKDKYKKDEKYARLHKRIREKRKDLRETKIFNALSEIKENADHKVLNNPRMMANDGYFIQFMSPIVISGFENNNIELDADSAEEINGYTTKEYLNEYNQITLW